MDATSAYWAVQLKEADKEKTAFSVPRGKYGFNVMPFGLSNAGATFQRLIMDIHCLPTEHMVAYSDDVIMFSMTFSEHTSDLARVFDRFSGANMSLSPEKYVFGSKEVNFLGCNLSEEGIKPNEGLVEVIQNFQRPNSKREVKRFLGTVGFYRNFIKDFANISKPLRELRPIRFLNGQRIVTKL